MKKFLQKFSWDIENETFVVSIRNKFMDFVNLHPDLFCFSLLIVACLVFLFFGLNCYPLMDVDETRYAVMSRDLLSSFDWNSLHLNSVPFLEKPPLYFWLVAGSIKLFGEFSAFAVRFPIAILASFLVFFTYYVGTKIISRKFGMISALILLSSVFFLILSHVAIIDMVLTVFMTSAIYCSFLTTFAEEQNKKYYWWYFYLFIGLGFLAKGILALAIPVTVVFIYKIFTKTPKEIFKPINIIPGMVIFLIIALPWHLMMYQEYGFKFVKEYFILHHFARFMNSETIGRERPFLYFVPVFLLGFMPWTFVFIAFICDGLKKIYKKFKETQGKIKDRIFAVFEAKTNEQRMLLFFSVYFIVVFLVFSSSSTKLPTYILPIFPAASFLTGYYWWISDEKNEHQKSISITTEIFAAIFILAAIGATVAYYFLPDNLQYDLDKFKTLTAVSLSLFGMLLILRLKTKRALSVFSGYIFTMVFVILLAVSQIFNFVYSTGENEIVDYSAISTTLDGSSRLVTFDFAVKPSALIMYKDYVNFLPDPDFAELDKLLDYRGGNTFVIIKNKNMLNDEDYKAKIGKRLTLLKRGEKYSLYVKDITNEFKNKPLK